MTPVPFIDDRDFTLYRGDALVTLQSLPEASVDCVVTSPPYWGLRDYGADGQLGLEATSEEFVAGLVAVFREVRRVLVDTGTCWINLGDSYVSTSSGSLEGSTLGSSTGQTAHSRRAQVRDGKAVHDDLLSPYSVQGLAPKNLVGIPWRVAFALQADGWYLRSEIIWCLSGGARVYAQTQKGEMPMTVKDLVRLDPATVKLWNGEKWTQALGWSRSYADGTALEIELRSGERVGCTVGHQWPTQRGLVRADELLVGDVFDTTRLPEPAAPDSPRAIPDEFGYFVGLYIAEGSMSGDTIQIASHASEVEHRTVALGYLTHDYGASIRSYIDGNKATICVDSPVAVAALRLYVAGRTSHDKGLKVAVWRRSDEFLRRVLYGYITADGHYDRKNDRYRLGFTRNDRLAADLRTLCARLGLPLRLRPTTVEGFGKKWPAYRGDLRWTPSAHHNARRGSEIVAIRRSRARQFWDIGVADEPHTFSLASGVLTHNSKPNPMPESVTDRPTKSHEYVFLLTKSPRYYFDQDAVREPYNYDGRKMTAISGSRPGERAHENYANREGKDRWPGLIRPVTEQKAFDALVASETYEDFEAVLGVKKRSSGNKERKHGVDVGAPGGTTSDLGRGIPWTETEGGRNIRSVWEIATQPTPEAHFATYPEELVRRCILAGCPEGGTVLDPFMGSGTTAKVARDHRRRAVGIELNPTYCDLIARRLQQLSFLAEPEIRP